MKKNIIFQLGDGQCICSKHWQKEFEAREPVTGWTAGECDWCKRSEAAAALGRSRTKKKAAASRENGKKGGRPSMKQVKEKLNIRIEKQGYVNGTLHYKVWRFRQDQNAYVFDGSYTYKELKEEANL